MKAGRILVACLRNELSIDRESVERLGLCARDSLPRLMLPRPIRSLSFSRKINEIGISGSVLMLILAPFLIMGVFTFQFCRLIGAAIVFKVEKKSVSFGSVVLSLHGKAECCYKAAVGGGPITILSKRRLLASPLLMLGASYLKAIAFMMRIFKKAVKSFVGKGGDVSYIELLLQSYVVFELIVLFDKVRDGLIDADTVYISNHYDRWAVLVDHLFPGFHLIQHGALVRMSLPYRLRKVGAIHTCNDASAEIFMDTFVWGAASPVLWSYESKLYLQEVVSEYPTVLYVGEPHLVDFEIPLLNKISSSFDVKVFLKPHPRFPLSPYNCLLGVEVIRDKDFYPRVDLVVYVGSTLGEEYEAAGVRTLKVSKSLGFDDVLSKVRSALNE